MLKSLVRTDPEKSRRKRESNHGSAALEVDALTTRPTRCCLAGEAGLTEAGEEHPCRCLDSPWSSPLGGLEVWCQPQERYTRGSNTAFPAGFSLGWSYQGLHNWCSPYQVSGVIGSMLRLVGLVSIYCLGEVESLIWSAWCQNTDFSCAGHTSDFKMSALVATLLDVWYFRVSAGTGWPGVRLLSFPGLVISGTYAGLPCQASGVIESVPGLVGLVSEYCGFTGPTTDFNIGASGTASGVIGSVLGLVGPASEYCDWVR